MNALARQEDGDHYRKRAIQPVQFIAVNRWDFFLGSSLKYLTRWRDKAGAVDLRKARHFPELREATDPGYLIQPTLVMPMEDYLAANKILEGDDATALLALDIYAYRPTPTNREVLFRCIDRLLAIAS